MRVCPHPATLASASLRTLSQRDSMWASLQSSNQCQVRLCVCLLAVGDIHIPKLAIVVCLLHLQHSVVELAAVYLHCTVHSTRAALQHHTFSLSVLSFPFLPGPAGAASIGVIRVNDMEALQAAYTRVVKDLSKAKVGGGCRWCLCVKAPSREWCMQCVDAALVSMERLCVGHQGCVLLADVGPNAVTHHRCCCPCSCWHCSCHCMPFLVRQPTNQPTTQVVAGALVEGGDDEEGGDDAAAGGKAGGNAGKWFSVELMLEEVRTGGGLCVGWEILG